MCRLSLLFLVVVALLSLSLASGQSCSGAGYDLSSLVGQVYNWSTPIVGGQTNYTYVVSPCGSLSTCSNASICQIATDSGGYYPLQLYNSSVQQQWVAVPGGVMQTIQDGQFCGAINAYRATSIFFQCNPAATTAVLTGVKETETCHYQATLQTAAACTASGTTGANGVGSSFESSVCGGGVFDLSSLNTDLYFNSNASSSTDGFNFWLHLCGVVTNSSCNQYPAAMACQTDKQSPPDQYELAYLNASIPGIYTINSNGLTMKLQDGTSCGSDGPRALTVNLVCSQTSTTPVLTAFAEGETCHYVANVLTSAVCAPATVGSSTAAVAPVASSSSAGSVMAASSSTAGSVVVGGSSSTAAVPVVVLSSSAAGNGTAPPSNPSTGAAFATSSSSVAVLLLAALTAAVSLTL